MTEGNESEIILLRQAIARLSDRMEHMEQALRKLERVQPPPARPVENNMMAAREQVLSGKGPDNLVKEVAPRPQPAAPLAPVASAPSFPALLAPVVPAPLTVQPQVPAPAPAIHAAAPALQAPPPAQPPQVPPVNKRPVVQPAPVPAIPASAAAAKIPAAAAVPVVPERPLNEKPRRDIELNIGKYWLNKIGIGIFVLGVGFLVAYSSRYFGQLGPWSKVATGYLVSAMLFFSGRKLERKEKMTNFGHVITGGAWALAYFTTFAMQHFPQSRVLASEGLDLLLLAGVAAGMLLHSLKYRSEALSGVAIFVGYATATIGDVRIFTLLSCALESVVILVLVYKFKWLRMLFLGILMTYGAHFLWVMKNIHGAASAGPALAAGSFFLLNGTFLTLYWAVFTAGAHLMRKPGDGAFEGRLCAANAGNAVFYFLLLYPDVTRLFPDQRFAFVLALGAAFLLLAGVLYRCGKGKLYACDAFIGVALITVAIPIKYMPAETALLWIAELPLLYYTGLALKSRTVRAAAFLLFAWIIAHYFYYVAGGGGMVRLLGLGSIPMSGFTAFAAALSFGGVFTLLKRAFARGELTALENNAGQIFPAAAAAFLCLGTVLTSAPQNLTLYLFADAGLLFGWGCLVAEASVRMSSLLLLAAGLVRFAEVDNYLALAAGRRWAYIGAEVFISYAIYFQYRRLRLRALLGELESALVTYAAVISGILVVTAVFRYVPENWITVTLAGLSLFTFIVARLAASRALRITALAGTALVAVRFIFLDSFPSAGLADWAVLAFVPLSQAGVYHLYRGLRAAGKLSAEEVYFPDAGYALFQLTSMALVFYYVPEADMTPVFAVMNLALFAAGCLQREKFARSASLFILPVVLARFLGLDNYAAGVRLLPLTGVLGSYYALAYAYKKAGDAGVLEQDELPLTHMAFGAAAFLTVAAIWKYAPAPWAAACMALSGLGSVVYGCSLKSADIRLSGGALLAAALLRAVLWDDYSSMGPFLRWAPAAAQAFSFGAAYLAYRNLRLAEKLPLVETRVEQAVFAGLAVLTVVSLTRYCPQYWAGGTLAAASTALFLAGRALGERFVRVGACLMFTVVAGRALAFAEPYENLGGLRWLPIGAQLAALLGVYLPYRAMTRTKALPETEKPVPLAVYVTLLGLLVFYVTSYGAAPLRPLLFTAAYLAFFAGGIRLEDAPLRAAWLLLAPAAFAAYLTPMRDLSAITDFLYAAAVSGGMYAVYGCSAGRLKNALSWAEKKYLPALCMAAAVAVLLSIAHYAPAALKTAAAAAALATLYTAGTILRDDKLALSAFVFAPYIFMKRLGNEDYAAIGPLSKWFGVLAAPAAFLWVHLTEVKYPERVLKDLPLAYKFFAGMVPGVILLLHALFFYASASMLTLSLGLAGLAFFAPGFYFRDKALRYAGLLLFAVAVLRIGAVDIAGLPILFKIISFIALGLILLSVSYIYTRFMSEEPPEAGK